MEAVQDVAQLPDPALAAHIERCERLLRHPTLLGRLPDGGDGIRERFTLYAAEKARREVDGAALGIGKTMCNTSRLRLQEKEISLLMDKTSDGVQPTTRKTLVESIAPVPFPLHNTHKNEGCGVTGETESYEEAARAVGEKYRHSKVPVEAIVRQMFGGSHCETEIQRILRDVPPNFFLTHEENISMQRRLFSEKRRDMLDRLRYQQRTGLQK